MTLEKNDIQGILRFGYGNFQARFLMVEISDATKAKEYLKAVLPFINSAEKFPESKLAVHVAFTCQGLNKLNLSKACLSSFPREFIEGMHLPPRPVLLGDVNANDPSKWEWGGVKGDADFIMLCYADTQEKLDAFTESELEKFASFGLTLSRAQESVNNIDGKEHFGFKDGISNPVIEGMSESRKMKNEAMPGEFILGYQNDYEIIPTPPTIGFAEDKNNILPVWKEDEKLKDLGRNGSFMVYRQMSQDVAGFWKYLAENSQETATNNAEAAVKLGAKMVGRWPNGNALVLHPSEEGEKSNLGNPDNNFGYWNEDKSGAKCPYGSHIRRTNPRDWVPTEVDQDTSSQMVRKHGLLRRGRAYGKPLVEDLDINKMINMTDDGEKRGLHFICMVANIGRQFEFVMNSWVRSGQFAGLYNDSDPLIAAVSEPGELANNEFTSPVEGGLRRKYKNLPQFTRLIGGSYFFLPGITALKFIIESNDGQ